jgi:hypothetical protein
MKVGPQHAGAQLGAQAWDADFLGFFVGVVGGRVGTVTAGGISRY